MLRVLSVRVRLRCSWICFFRSFFLQLAKQNSVESCHSKHFATPYFSIHLPYSKSRVDTSNREIKFVKERFCATFFTLTTYSSLSWLIVFFLRMAWTKWYIAYVIWILQFVCGMIVNYTDWMWAVKGFCQIHKCKSVSNVI